MNPIKEAKAPAMAARKDTPAMERPSDAEPTVEQAMDLLLRREREAEVAVSACRDRAARIIGEARRAGRHIGHRTDARISALNARCAQAIADRIAALEREERGRVEQPLDPEGAEHCVEVVTARVAARLTRRD
jgi:hypothetical protein